MNAIRKKSQRLEVGGVKADIRYIEHHNNVVVVTNISIIPLRENILLSIICHTQGPPWLPVRSQAMLVKFHYSPINYGDRNEPGVDDGNGGMSLRVIRMFLSFF